MRSTSAFDTDPADATGSIEELVDQVSTAPISVLAVWAHPDDESYLGAGLMAEVAARGGTVHSVTATLGEHGTDDPDRHPPRVLAARRRAELEQALTALGATGQVLGFADGALADVPEELGVRRIGAVIEEIGPDLVLSFGHDGVTGHPDHRAVGRWTQRAVTATAPALPLLTTAAGAAWPTDLVDAMRATGAFWPGHPERQVDTPSWTVELDRHRLDQKLRALACHESQVEPLRRSLGADGYRRLAAVEAYRAANPAALRLLTAEQLAS